MQPLNRLARKPLKLLHALEDGTLLLLVLTMIALCCAQIIMRNLEISGMVWGENAIRINVLWLAMFGALRASREQSHITIDLFSRYGHANARKAVHFLVSISCSAICGIAAWHSLLFVRNEYEEHIIAFLNVPSWLCEAIIPVALAIISVRFLYHSLHLPDNNVDNR